MPRIAYPRRLRVALATLAIAALLSAAAAAPAAASDEDSLDAAALAPAAAEVQLTVAAGVERIAGASRFETAVEISKSSFEPGVNVVLIANGMSFPDALSGAPVAGLAGAPILLVTADGIPAVVKAELKRLAPQYIAVLGGPGAVNAKVFDQLKGYAATGEVDRLGAADRYATSAYIAETVWSGQTATTVFIANGATFPDALSAGPAAGVEAAPLLLVPSSTIPAVIKSQLKALKPTNIVVMGGRGAVSTTVFDQLQSYAKNVFRVAGTDRFDTAVTMSSWYWDGVETPTVFISSGMQFPDALAVAPVAAGLDVPLLLVQPNEIPASVKAELKARKPQRIVIVGGTGAVSSAVAKQLNQYIVP